MKVIIEFDAKKNKPIIVIEAENQNEEDQLQLIAGFNEASFRILINDES